jgi:uncharacterized membrane protein
MSYYFAWLFVAMPVLTLVGAVYTYRQEKKYRNGKSLLAIIILAALALSALLLAIAQARGILTARSSVSPFLTIFVLTTAVRQLAFPNKSYQGRGWRIFNVCFVVFAVILAIYVVVGYIYNW